MQALAKINNMQLTTMDDLRTIGEVFAKSGFFKDSMDVSKAIVKIIAGAELGFGPVASMTGIYIVKERVTLSANLIGAAIKRSGRYNYRVTQHTDQACAIEFLENGQSIGASAFTMQDARKAGLDSSQTWTKFPRNMLFARALSNGAKWFCPDVFGGPVYTPDELGADVAMTEDGEMTVVNEPQQPAKVLPLPPVQTITIDEIEAEELRQIGFRKGFDLDAIARRKGKPQMAELTAEAAKDLRLWLNELPDHKPVQEAPAEAQQQLTATQQRIIYFWSELAKLGKERFSVWAGQLQHFSAYLDTNNIEFNAEINTVSEIPDEHGEGYAKYLANAYDAETSKKDDPLI